MERWAKVQGFQGFVNGDNLEASDQGNVRYADTHELLPQRITKQRYYYVIFCKGGQAESVHRLVLRAFVGPPTEELCIACHGDGDPTNNTLENLRWGTPADNADDLMHHRYAGMIPPRKRRRKRRARKVKHEHFQEWLASKLPTGGTVGKA